MTNKAINTLIITTLLPNIATAGMDASGHYTPPTEPEIVEVIVEVPVVVPIEVPVAIEEEHEDTASLWQQTKEVISYAPNRREGGITMAVARSFHEIEGLSVQGNTLALGYVSPYSKHLSGYIAFSTLENDAEGAVIQHKTANQDLLRVDSWRAWEVGITGFTNDWGRFTVSLGSQDTTVLMGDLGNEVEQDQENKFTFGIGYDVYIPYTKFYVTTHYNTRQVARIGLGYQF